MKKTVFILSLLLIGFSAQSQEIKRQRLKQKE